jgi:hypothetical protein
MHQLKALVSLHLCETMPISSAPLCVSAFVAPLPLAGTARTRTRRSIAGCGQAALTPARRPRMSATTQNFGETEHENTDDDSDGVSDGHDMEVFRRGSIRPYHGDSLPFSVKIVSPPPKTLGTFQLNPRTSCGDIIRHNDCAYVVKRVSQHYQYNFQLGAAEMYKKSVEVKSIARKSLEQYLERTLQDN